MSTSGGFDLNNKSVAELEDEGRFVHFYTPDGQPMYFGESTKEFPEGLPVGIWMAGSLSNIHRRAEEAIRKRPLKQGKLTQGKFFDETVDKTAACALRWQGFYHGDQEVPFSRENVRKLFANFPDALDQCIEGMNDHKSFLMSSSPS